MTAAPRRLLFAAAAPMLFFVGFQLTPGSAEQLASAAPTPQARHALKTTLVLKESFASTPRGWAGKNSRLTPLRRAAGARFAIRVSPTPRARGTSRRITLYAAPRPVRVTTARRVYTASARIRGVKSSTRRVCLSLREIRRGTVVRSASDCVRARGGWRRVSVRLAAARNGSQIGVVVASSRARFDVDAVNVGVVRRLAAAPPGKCKAQKCLPPSPPATTPTTTTTTAPPTTTTAPPPTTTTAPTPTTPAPTPAPTPELIRFSGLETGDFSGFDQTNAAPGLGAADPTTLSVSTARAYDGGYSAAAHTSANLTSANKYSRTIFHNLSWAAGTDVWYGCAFYLPAGFYAKQQGQIDLMRWDNWTDDPTTTDRGGIVIYGPPATGQAYLVRARLGSGGSELIGPFSISEEKWHWLEVHQRFSADHAGDLSEVYLDGNLVGSSNARNWNDRRITSIRFGVVAVNDGTQSNPVDLWFDRAVLARGKLGPLG